MTVARPELELEPRWGLGDVALGLGLFGGATVAIVAAILVDRADGEPSFGPASGTALATILLINVLVFVGVPLLTSRRKGTGSLAADFGLRVRLGDLPIGAAGGFVAIVFGAAASGLLLTALGEEAGAGARYAGVDQLGERLLLHAVIGLLVPAAEELFFRGMLLRSLLKRNGPILSLVASSALFALLHVAGAGQLGALQAAMVVSTGIFGLVFGALTLGTDGRLGAAIVAHVLLNQTALALALW